MIKKRMNLKSRPRFFLGGGGGGALVDPDFGPGGGDELVDSDFGGGGVAGGIGLASAVVVGGIDEGGAVCTLLPGGDGGTRGTFSGIMVLCSPGVKGVAAPGIMGATGPGGGGVGAVAVWLWDPGRTTASES